MPSYEEEMGSIAKRVQELQAQVASLQEKSAEKPYYIRQSLSDIRGVLLDLDGPVDDLIKSESGPVYDNWFEFTNDLFIRALSLTGVSYKINGDTITIRDNNNKLLVTGRYVNFIHVVLQMHYGITFKGEAELHE